MPLVTAGSSTSGGIRNITFRHVTVEHSSSPVCIRTCRNRGGAISDVSFCALRILQTLKSSQVLTIVPLGLWCPFASEAFCSQITYENITARDVYWGVYISANFSGKPQLGSCASVLWIRRLARSIKPQPLVECFSGAVVCGQVASRPG